jgi:poly(A) polymerase
VLAHSESGAPAADAAFAAPDRFLAETPVPKPPFGGADLIARGVAAGPRVGQTLRAFQALWIRAGFPEDPETLARLLEEAATELARGSCAGVRSDAK